MATMLRVTVHPEMSRQTSRQTGRLLFSAQRYETPEYDTLTERLGFERHGDVCVRYVLYDEAPRLHQDCVEQLGVTPALCPTTPIWV